LCLYHIQSINLGKKSTKKPTKEGCREREGNELDALVLWFVPGDEGEGDGEYTVTGESKGGG